jgi:hypothetical protein
MGEKQQQGKPGKSTGWTAVEAMVSTVTMFMPAAARVDLAEQLVKLAAQVRGDALEDMGKPRDDGAHRAPYVDTEGSVNR